MDNRFLWYDRQDSHQEKHSFQVLSFPGSMEVYDEKT